MAPPRKRVRLTEPELPPFRPQSDPAIFEHMPAFAHFASDLPLQSSTLDKRPVPTRIEEVHLKIQQHSAITERAKQARLHRRQLGTIVATINADGSSVLSIIDATPTPSTTAGPATSEPSSTKVVSTLLDSSTTALPSYSAFTSSTSAAAARNSTLTLNTHSTALPSQYLATLTNSNVKTLTRHSSPYTTTFNDGQTTTVCGRFGNCALASSQSTISSTDSTTRSSTTTKTHSPTQSLSSASFTSSSPTPSLAPGTPSPSTPTSPSSTASATPTSSNNDSATPLPSATIAGGVVGGFAGIAVILLLALVVLRWYKRRAQNGHHALPPSTSSMLTDEGGGRQYSTPGGGSGMVERAGLAPLMSAVPALFRHQNRSVEDSGTESAGAGLGNAGEERGFTKVSGRKLASAFSEGMTREHFHDQKPQQRRRPPPPPRPPRSDLHPRQEAERADFTGTSFYRDSNGFYGGIGQQTRDQEGGRSLTPNDEEDAAYAGPFADPAPSASTLTLSPGPQRRPTIHTPGPYVLGSTSVPPSPRLLHDSDTRDHYFPPGTALSTPGDGYSAGVGRSESPVLPGGRSGTPSTVGGENRGSRFAEDV